MKLVSRQHLRDLQASANVGNHRNRLKKFREINTTLLVSSFTIAVMLYFLPEVVLTMAGISTETVALTNTFCRISIASILPRAIVLILSEVILVPQLAAIPLPPLGLHVLSIFILILITKLVLRQVTITSCALVCVISDVILAAVSK